VETTGIYKFFLPFFIGLKPSSYTTFLSRYEAKELSSNPESSPRISNDDDAKDATDQNGAAIEYNRRIDHLLVQSILTFVTANFRFEGDGFLPADFRQAGELNSLTSFSNMVASPGNVS